MSRQRVHQRQLLWCTTQSGSSYVQGMRWHRGAMYDTYRGMKFNFPLKFDAEFQGGIWRDIVPSNYKPCVGHRPAAGY